jgi:Peptidase inhibitor family I36
MTQVMKGSRRIVIAAVAAALLGGALLSISAAPASAARHPCGQGEFCLYFNEDANGGYYHSKGSDPNLDNDHYEGGDTGEIVGDTSRYVSNNGVPANKSDVIIYGLPGYRGARNCIFINDKGQLPHEWWNNIESYRWVTRTECLKAGPLPLFD